MKVFSSPSLTAISLSCTAGKKLALIRYVPSGRGISSIMGSSRKERKKTEEENASRMIISARSPLRPLK